MFDAAKEAFDHVTTPIEMAVEVALLGAVGARGNDRLGTTGGDDVDQRVAVVGFVAATDPAAMPASSGAASLTSAACPALKRQRAWSIRGKADRGARAPAQ